MAGSSWDAADSGRCSAISRIRVFGIQTATTAAAISAVTIPMMNVAPVAIENDVWIAPTMAGINGSTLGLELLRNLGQDGGPEVAHPGQLVQVPGATGRERARELGWDARIYELVRDLLEEHGREERASNG